ncbi:unnamed protein product [Arabidopsis halleri]
MYKISRMVFSSSYIDYSQKSVTFSHPKDRMLLEVTPVSQLNSDLSTCKVKVRIARV